MGSYAPVPAFAACRTPPRCIGSSWTRKQRFRRVDVARPGAGSRQGRLRVVRVARASGSGQPCISIGSMPKTFRAAHLRDSGVKTRLRPHRCTEDGSLRRSLQGVRARVRVGAQSLGGPFRQRRIQVAIHALDRVLGLPPAPPELVGLDGIPRSRLERGGRIRTRGCDRRAGAQIDEELHGATQGDQRDRQRSPEWPTRTGSSTPESASMMTSAV